MNEQDEKLLNEVMDSLYHCIDLLGLLTEEQDLNKNISRYLGALKILKNELYSDLNNIQQYIRK